MKILIADDEKLARLRLQHLLADLDENFEVVAEASNGVQALQKWKQTDADILLLDIEMPELNGLQVAETVSKQTPSPAVIFTTAYNSHALKAFETHAVDYLLKPIRKDRLQTALHKAQALQQSQWQQLKTAFPEQSHRTHLCVFTGHDLHLVPVNEVIYFRAEQKYISVKTSQHEYLLDESLKALEEEFSGLFLRIHRNALVALTHIDELYKQEDGQVIIKFQHSEETLTVSRRLVTKVKQALQHLKL